jgi:cyanophycin synthetase
MTVVRWVWSRACPKPLDWKSFTSRKTSRCSTLCARRLTWCCARRVAVINAHDAAAAELADLSDGDVIYYATDATLPVIEAHLAQGGKAVLCQDGQLTLATGDKTRPLFEHRQQPCMADELRTGVLLATVATAWALDIPLTVVRAGIESELPLLDLAQA